MRLTKSTLSKLLASGLVLASLAGCKKEDNTNNNNNNLEHPLGWDGSTERADTVPKNLNYFGDGKLGNSDALPNAVDLSALNLTPPVGDQGQFGTCVAWATAYGMKSTLEAVSYNLTTAQMADQSKVMSPKDLFIAIDDNVKGASNCDGTNFTPALDVVLNRGVATMAAVPYNLSGNCSKSQQDASWEASANKHKISRYRRIAVTDAAGNLNGTETITAIKQALAEKSPVVFGAQLADNFMSWGASDVIYSSHSSFDNVGIHAYHAMLIIGYDNSKGSRGAFKVLNSWSPNWGNSGFIWVDQQFMVNGFSFGGNFFTAANLDGKPDDNTNPQPDPNPTGVDVLPWVTLDYSNTTDEPQYPTRRDMFFDIYNIGTQNAAVSSGMGYAYIFYNAYDANDYGVAFYDQMSASVPQGQYQCHAASASQYAGCAFNGAIASNSSLGIGLFGAQGADGIHRWYYMPTNVTGTYYLVLIADVNEKFTEQDENNNLFYTTDQYPLDFQDGIEQRRSGVSLLNYKFQNPLGAGLAAVMNPQGAHYRTAVNGRHPNAYSPKEIVGFLKAEARNGGLQRKIQEYKHRSATLPHGVAAASR